MGFFSGLAKPASGVDGFLAALRDKVDRDRLLAAQAIVQGDPAAAMEIRARSQAIDAQRAEAKERARQQRMAKMMDKKGQLGLEARMATAGSLESHDAADTFAGSAPGFGAGPSFSPIAPAAFPGAGGAALETDPHRPWLQRASHQSGGDPFRSAIFGRQGMPMEIAPTLSAERGMLPPGHGFRPPLLRLAAVQEGFERRQDRWMAEEQARATGRDADDVYGEMRGLGRQGTAPAPTAPNPPSPAPDSAPRAMAPARTAPPIAPSQTPAPATPPPRRSGGRFDVREVERRAANALRLYDYFIDKERMSSAAAAGWAASAAGESDSDYRSREQGGGGYGLFQWTYPPRRQAFQSRFGYPIEQSSEEDQLAFRRWEAKVDEGLQSALGAARTPGDHAEVITRIYERPADPDVDSIDRANIAEAIRVLALNRKAENRR